MKLFGKLLCGVLASALLLAACGGGTADEEEESSTELIDLATVFDTTGTGATQDKATVTVNGSDATFSGPEGSEMWGELVAGEHDFSQYSGFSIEYKSSGSATIFAQDTNTIFVFATEGDGWGAVASATEWTKLSLPFSILANQGWFGDGTAAFNAASVIKFCVQLTGGGTFEVRNFSGIKK